MPRVLITGGAGFIGSHLADELLAAEYQVRVLDSLSPQVHIARRRPDYLPADIDFREGNVCHPDDVLAALNGVDMVVHFAAAVGVGQSMYEIAHYTEVNNLGTAILLQALIDRPVARLVVASSMSIYGEGLYRNAAGEPVAAAERPREQLERGQWEVLDAAGRPLAPVPTTEDKVAAPSSVYALSKYDQERLCLICGAAYQIPTVALRFFNVYGPRQALSNPYTGVLAIFAARLLQGKAPLIYEDGLQRRDFVNVHDVARACRLALEQPNVAGEVFNIGSGRSVTIRDVADEVAAVLGREDLRPELSHRFRVGDIRHCFADIGKAQRLLGYEPSVSFRQGLVELAAWLETQVVTDSAPDAHRELAARGLMV